MTLQDILRILDFNPLWEKASKEEKVTAINQVLNDFGETLLYDSAPLKYSYNVHPHNNTTYKQLQKILGLGFTGDKILVLFQYSVLEHTVLSPMQFSLEPSDVTNIQEETFTISINADFINRHKQTKQLSTFTFSSVPSYKIQPKALQNQSFSIEKKVEYRKIDSSKKELAFTLDYLPSYRINSSVFNQEVSLDYSVTYLIWE